MEHYDAIVIGAGQSGGPITSALTENGLRTAIVERKHVGGSCINFGCTPTKTMMASSKAAHDARNAPKLGVDVCNVEVDIKRVIQRKREIVESFRQGTFNALQSTRGLDLIMGAARFTGFKEIEIELNDGRMRTLSAEKFFINTGTRSSMPPLDGLEKVPAHSSTTLMDVEEIPEHLLILGGGYIGLELGQMYRHFGSQVTILQRGPQLLKDEDRDIAEAIREILEDDGVRVMLDSNVEAACLDSQGRITLSGNQNGTALRVTGTHFLVATGRQPNTDDLDAALTGLDLDEAGFIPVNERLETSVDGIWALGDVTGGPAFTHVSYDDYRILKTNLFGEGGRTTTDRLEPYVVFTHPELGRVGLTERSAREAGYDVKIASMEMTGVARAVEVGETRGLLKAVINAENDQILGAALLGIAGGEAIAFVHLAMLSGTPYTTLRDMVISHPTVMESMNNLFRG